MPFQPFDPKADRAEYRRHLPHWSQPGSTYFITFRLADSLPASVLRQHREDRAIWLNAHGLDSEDQLSRLPISEQWEYHRHFNREWHRYLDAGHGACLLRLHEYARIVAQSLLHFDGQRCAIGDFVVMPNHVHLLATPFPGWDLSSLSQSWKGFSSREVNRLRSAKGSLWMDESFDHIVRSEEQLRYYRKYIGTNPSKARLPEGEYLLGCGSDAESLASDNT